MNYNRDDITEVWNFLFPEPLEADEYIEIAYGPEGPSMAQHVQTIDEAFDFLDEQDDAPCNYGLHWCTKKPGSKLHKRTGKHEVHRAWAFIADIEDRVCHEHMDAPRMTREVWERAQAELPDWVHDGSELMAYTGGGLQVYVRLSEPVTGVDLKNLFWSSQDAPGAIGNTYDVKRSHWVDPCSLQTWQGQRLIGTHHPKHDVNTTIIRRDMGGSPLDVRRLLADYAPRLEWLKKKQQERQAKTQVRRATQTNGDPFEDIKNTLRMIPYFGINKRHGGDNTYTPVHCPLCDGEDNGNASVNHHSDGDKLFCFKDESHCGDIFDIYQYQYGCSRQEALIALADAAGIDLDSYKTGSTPKKKAKAREEIIDVGSWLSANGADLTSVIVYRVDGVLGLDIPFNVKGRIVRVVADWDVWQNVKTFKKHVSGRLGIVFRQYPSKNWPLYKFMERCIANAGPDGIENRDIEGEIEVSMLDQFLSMFWSCTPLTPSNIADYIRTGGQHTDPAPDWWEDAADMTGPGDAAVVYKTADGYYIRRSGFQKRLRSEYDGEWNTRKFVEFIKGLGFSDSKPRFGDVRKRSWFITTERMEKNK